MLVKISSQLIKQVIRYYIKYRCNIVGIINYNNNIIILYSYIIINYIGIDKQ